MDEACHIPTLDVKRDHTIVISWNCQQTWHKSLYLNWKRIHNLCHVCRQFYRLENLTGFDKVHPMFTSWPHSNKSHLKTFHLPPLLVTLEKQYAPVEPPVKSINGACVPSEGRNGYFEPFLEVQLHRLVHCVQETRRLSLQCSTLMNGGVWYVWNESLASTWAQDTATKFIHNIDNQLIWILPL